MSGYAKCTLENHTKFEKGNRHNIGLFTLDTDYQKNISSIKKFIKELGWDSVEFYYTEEIHDKRCIKHDVLIQGMNRAYKNGQALIVNDTPIYMH
ncbi:hypothetical protein AADZ91_01640 [Colwelliaceae bacterium 6441]